MPAGNYVPANLHAQQSPAAQNLDEAIVHTVAYVDVFDFPLKADEVHRYLKRVAASPEQVQHVLGNGRLVPDRLARRDNYYMLPGREEIVEVRHEREIRARMLWPYAAGYGRIISGLPYVKMVAVTGSLAVNNVDARGDIDYFIVTQPDRLWISRAFVVLIVRLAARRGLHLCPNYFVTTNALTFSEQSLYAAHELAQMVPLTGAEIYERMREQNGWLESYLPNAHGAPFEKEVAAAGGSLRLFRRSAETVLSTSAGSWLEKWEMRRKIAKFAHQTKNRPAVEAAFCEDWCKGHFDNHGERALEAFAGRVGMIQELGETDD